MARSSKEISEMLLEWSNGHQEVLEELMPLVYDELRRERPPTRCSPRPWCTRLTSS